MSDLHSGSCFQSASVGITLPKKLLFHFSILLVRGLRGLARAGQMEKNIENQKNTKKQQNNPTQKQPTKN